MYKYFNKKGKEIFSNEEIELEGVTVPKFYVDMESVSTRLVSTTEFYILQDSLDLKVINTSWETQTEENFFTYTLDLDSEGLDYIVKGDITTTGREVLSNTQKLYEFNIGFSSENEIYQYEHLKVYIDGVLSLVIEFYSEAIPLDQKFQTMAVDNLKNDFRETDYKAIFSSDVDEELPDYKVINRKNKEFILEYLNLIGSKSSYKSLINILKYFEYGDRLTLKEYWLKKEGNITSDFSNYAFTNLDENFNDTNAFLRKGFIKTNFLGLFYKLNRFVGFDSNGDEITEVTSEFTIEEIIIKLNYLRNYLDRSAYLPEPFEITGIIGEFVDFHSYIFAYWTFYEVNYNTRLNLEGSTIEGNEILYLRSRTYNEYLDDPDYTIIDVNEVVPVINPNEGNLDFYTTYKKKLSAIFEVNFTLGESINLRDIVVRLEKYDELLGTYQTLIEISNKELIDIESLSFALFNEGKYRLNYTITDFYSAYDVVEKVFEVKEHEPCMRTFSLVGSNDIDGEGYDDLGLMPYNESVKTLNVANQTVYDSVNYEYNNTIFNKSLGVSDYDLRKFKPLQNRNVTPEAFGVHHYLFRYDLYGDGVAGDRRLTLTDAFGKEEIILPNFDGVAGIEYAYECLTIISKSSNRIFSQFNYNVEWYEKDVGVLRPVIVGLSKKKGTINNFTIDVDSNILDPSDIEILNSSIPYCDIYAVNSGSVSIEFVEDSATVYSSNLTVTNLETLLTSIQNVYPENLCFGIRDELGVLERIRVISENGNRLEINSNEVQGKLVGERTEIYKGLRKDDVYGQDYPLASVVGGYIDSEFLGDFYDIKWELYKNNKGQKVKIDEQNSFIYRNVLLEKGSYSLSLTYIYNNKEYNQLRNGVFLVL